VVVPHNPLPATVTTQEAKAKKKKKKQTDPLSTSFFSIKTLLKNFEAYD